MYKITRMYLKGGHRTIKTGLTLKEAQAHCYNPETSSETCKSAASKRITRRMGRWFDGYDEERQRRRRGGRWSAEYKVKVSVTPKKKRRK